jgi:hypothetical protein
MTDASDTEHQLAMRSYRYLRIGMVGAVLALAVSIAIERFDSGCWQTSISAYYYTPVRAVFVGGLMAIGMSLIAIKGSTPWEDTFFNFAGIMAPAVAVLPTMSVGDCWSVAPPSQPRDNSGQLADWLVANIDNNTRALLIAGFAGLVAAAVIAAIARRDLLAPARVGGRDLRVGLLATLVVLLVVLALHRWWDDFPTRAHGGAAVLMFVFLGAGIASNAWQRREKPERRTYMWIYIAVVAAMAAAGIVLPWFGGWDHNILILEAVEIALFVVFWLTQTREHWGDTNLAVADAEAAAAGPLPESTRTAIGG